MNKMVRSLNLCRQGTQTEAVYINPLVSTHRKISNIFIKFTFRNIVLKLFEKMKNKFNFLFASLLRYRPFKRTMSS